MSNHSSESQQGTDTEQLSPDELARLAAEEREDDRFTSSGGFYSGRRPTSSIAYSSEQDRLSGPEPAATEAESSDGESFAPRTEEELEYARRVVRDYKARRAQSQAGQNAVRSETRPTVQASESEVETSDKRALINEARHLTEETGIPHGVKTDIHGKPTVVRYGRNK